MFGTSRSLRSSVNSRTTRLTGLIAAVALGMGSLAGCAAGQISQTVDQVPNTDSASGEVGEIGVRDAIIATPDGPNYPAGSDAPITLWLTNSGGEPDTLTGITTSAGSVAISGDATVRPRSRLQIGGEGSALSATITALADDLNYGFSVPVTFTFATAGELSLNLPIAIPNEREADRPVIHIYPHEDETIWHD